MNKAELCDRLKALYEEAVAVYRENGRKHMTIDGAFDAGVIEGIRRALEEVVLADD